MTVATAVRVNCGSGGYNLPKKDGWINIDALPNVGADLVTSVPPLPFSRGEVDEVYAGHFLEHLMPDEARAFLDECHRVLTYGGTLALLVPDTHAIMARYLTGASAIVEWPGGTFRDMRDLDEIAYMFLYSYGQESHHCWSYDLRTLTRLVESSGFRVLGEIDRFNDHRVAVGAWYQVGVEAVKA